MAYSCLATHATVSTAIAAVERSGSWKMEGRTHATADLASVEQRLAALSQPKVPRPTRTVDEALAAERVPTGVWRDSQECRSIQSRYFQAACARVLELRRELAAAKDYEQLDARARELRQTLSAAPIIATSDPLPEAFAATFGRLLPLDGRAGVALLLTCVVEIISCFGLAALKVLRDGSGREAPLDSRASAQFRAGRDVIGNSKSKSRPSEGQRRLIPDVCLAAPRFGMSLAARNGTDIDSLPPSKVLPWPPARSREGGIQGRENSRPPARSFSLSAGAAPVDGSVAEFASDHLQPAAGGSIAAADARAKYKAWCAARGHTPMSQQRLGLELRRLGFAKWKSCGLIRYRDVELRA